jgi:hypothetical protein
LHTNNGQEGAILGERGQFHRSKKRCLRRCPPDLPVSIHPTVLGVNRRGCASRRLGRDGQGGTGNAAGTP